MGFIKVFPKSSRTYWTEASKRAKKAGKARQARARRPSSESSGQSKERKRTTGKSFAVSGSFFVYYTLFFQSKKKM